MTLITLNEAKNHLSIDFDNVDEEITNIVNTAEGYLYFATGFDFSTLADSLGELDKKMYDMARGWLFLRIYLDYYNVHTELDDSRLTAMIKQLQVYAMTVE